MPINKWVLFYCVNVTHGSWIHLRTFEIVTFEYILHVLSVYLKRLYIHKYQLKHTSIQFFIYLELPAYTYIYLSHLGQESSAIIG